jgi:transposase
MRKGFVGLALLVQEKLKRDPHQGHLFVFRGRRGSLIKVLWHDGQGMCLFAKRLERGRFIWPSPADGTVTITPAQLGYAGRDRLADAAADVATDRGGLMRHCESVRDLRVQDLQSVLQLVRAIHS